MGSDVGLSGLTFFFDRFRIPIIVPIILLLTATSQLSRLDYYSEVSSKGAGSITIEPSSITVVAANGGGIQAAPWTAKVLTGLQKEVGDQFGKSIRLISAVSGCSLGAMYFANEYTEGGPPSANALNSIVERAERSSLDKIGRAQLTPTFYV
jgi:hypothetical protein